ncbi:hypothetical protein evm_004787 [Chilo suppressalis]|nr:hypothetical protein evm_004787 [Chilo suppressalis]
MPTPWSPGTLLTDRNTTLPKGSVILLWSSVRWRLLPQTGAPIRAENPLCPTSLSSEQSKRAKVCWLRKWKH